MMSRLVRLLFRISVLFYFYFFLHLWLQSLSVLPTLVFICHKRRQNSLSTKLQMDLIECVPR